MLCLQWCECWSDKPVNSSTRPETTSDADICFYTSVLEFPIPIIFIITGLPHLYWLFRQPRVKPAPSLKFRAKILCTIAAFGCSLALAVDSLRTQDLLYKLSLWFTSLGWLLALSIVWVNNWRALPQQWVLRIWWLATFVAGLMLFIFHQKFHFSLAVHQLRGGYLFSVLLLAILSWSPRDQVPYDSVQWGSDLMESRRSSRGGSGGISAFLRRESSNVNEPLLGNWSSSNAGATYGALSSLGEGVEAWDNAIQEAAQERRSVIAAGDYSSEASQPQ